ncbi:MAG: M48 family metallopeptidase [Actinomycetota bacterium]|nr:M48 family metallopeptidase [Actinomycetota bacterium]
MSDAVRPSRLLCWAIVVVAGSALLVTAWLLVPWQWVPGGHYVQVPADQVFTPHEIARGSRYSGLQRHLAWASYAVSMAVALLLGLTSLGRRLLGRLRGPWPVRVALGVLVVLTIGTVVTLPFGWRMRSHDLAFGLTRQSAAGWWQDQGTALLVSWVANTIGFGVLIGMARRSPRRWPLWAAAAAAALTVAGSFVYPLVVEPLFNHFRPMQASALRSDIEALAAKEHVHVSDVLIADASRRTTTLNAYVSGFGSSRRVVIYDNLLHGVPKPQIEVIVAHELGHARHQDVVLGTALGALGAATGVGLLGLVMSSGALLRRTGVEGPGDPAGVASLLALVGIATFLASPIENSISRDIEARADRASLAATHDTPAFIAVQRRLAVSSLSDPTPPAWSQLWWGTHPTTLQRVGIAKALAGR